ncbi:deoxyribonuclease [Vibrio splendidus]|uniref:TatD family deoxyribonuclease n=1 Tax=Vibrio lentus TaxID=136468 RepID=A0A4U2ESI4_9VIBR|nr:TatD family hydrolase [Vibrio lentus]PHN86834.1 deoxyribonuclease [Vibrio splendidus]MCC4782515.1 TatD family hydrolase [Vibrio lentus]MCC4855598.1 TatD family hydrolase [Vibrio lentus]PME66587.1 deoxyribonuclease [Vibrio lentus]PMG56927.1 deoxyribonuclease [Vibrio lentus]
MTLQISDFPLFDTHCHADFEAFEQGFAPVQSIDGYLKEAEQAQVEKLIIPSIGQSNWRKLDEIAQSHPNIYYALGFHPYFLEQAEDEQFSELRQLLSSRTSQCVAIGECGLDFFVDVDRDKQERFFIQQMELAKAFELPLIIHERKSYNRLIELIKQHKFTLGGVIHGFSGSEQQALAWIKLGFYIGVGGTITYPRAQKTRTTIAKLPLECLVLETDAPDMPVYGNQGNVNHSKYLVTILNELILLRNETKQSVAAQIWQNSHRAFGICE